MFTRISSACFKSNFGSRKQSSLLSNQPNQITAHAPQTQLISHLKFPSTKPIPNTHQPTPSYFQPQNHYASFSQPHHISNQPHLSQPTTFPTITTLNPPQSSSQRVFPTKRAKPLSLSRRGHGNEPVWTHRKKENRSKWPLFPSSPLLLRNLPMFRSSFRNILSSLPAVTTTAGRRFGTRSSPSHPSFPSFLLQRKKPNPLLVQHGHCPTLVLTQSRRGFWDWISFHAKNNAGKGYTRGYHSYRHPGQRFKRGHQWAVYSNPEQRRRENLIVNTLTLFLLISSICLIFESNNLHDKHRYTWLSTFRAWLFGIVYRDDIKELRYKSTASTTPTFTSLNPHPSLPPQILTNGHPVPSSSGNVTSKSNLLGGSGYSFGRGGDVAITSCLNSPTFEIPIVPGTAGVFDPEYIMLLGDVESGGENGQDGHFHHNHHPAGKQILDHLELLNTIIDKSDQISTHHIAFSANTLFDSYQLLKDLNQNIGKLEFLTIGQKLSSFRYWYTLTQIRNFLGKELLQQHANIKDNGQLEYQMAMESCVSGNRVGDGVSSSFRSSHQQNQFSNTDPRSSAGTTSSPPLTTPSTSLPIMSTALKWLHYTPLSRFLPLPSEFIDAGSVLNLIVQSPGIFGSAARMIIISSTSSPIDLNNNKSHPNPSLNPNNNHSHPFGTYQQSLLIEQMLMAKALAIKCEELYRVAYHWGLFQLNYDNPCFRNIFGNGRQITAAAMATKVL